MRNLIKALCVAGMSLAMAAPAFAGAQLYSSIRYDTFYANQKGDKTNSAGDDSTTQLENTLAGNSRIGAKFTEGNLYAQWEMGLPGSNTRLAFGKYSFSGGSVLLGQAYNPWTLFSDQAYGGDNGFIGYGALYDGRQPQIKLDFSGFYIALVKTHLSTPGSVTTIDNMYTITGVNGHTASLVYTTTTEDTQYSQVPKIGIGYDGKAGPATFGAGFAYQTYKEQNTVSSLDESINSYLVYARASVAAGPVTIKGQASYGQNLANFGLLGRNSSAEISGNSVNNNKGYGGFVEVSSKMSAAASVNAGLGYTVDEVNNGNDKIKKMSIFVNAPIKIAEHFMVVPEFDYFHNSDPALGTSYADSAIPDTGLGNVKNAYVFGAKWQMDF